MNKILVLFLFILLLPALAESPTTELRALWVTRFEWPDPDPEKCKQNIVEIFTKMQQSGFNVALFQIRGAAEVCYPSHLEPWSQLLAAKSPGFDPLQLAIDEAHKRGIELHAYINPIPLYLWERYQAPPPKGTDPEHIYYQHGPNAGENSWVCRNPQGEIMVPGDAAYYYFSPGIPQVQVYLRKVIGDLVSRYDIDGLHLDRIRYPGKIYSHDPISKQRFQHAGNPEQLSWEDWQREQLNKFINDLYAEVLQAKPHITVSCAAWGIYNRHHIEGYKEFSSGYHDYFQDTWHWVELGAMDLLIPMIYWDIPAPKPNHDELLQDFITGVGKEHIVAGQRMYGPNWPVTENLSQIQEDRKQQAQGHAIFSYESANKKGAFALLQEKSYQQPAQVPSLPWKENPQTGTLLAKVLNKGEPVVDAWVKISPTQADQEQAPVFSQTWTSSADGRVAFLKIPPGKITLEITYQGVSKTYQGIAIAKGKVTVGDFDISKGFSKK